MLKYNYCCYPLCQRSITGMTIWPSGPQLFMSALECKVAFLPSAPHCATNMSSHLLACTS